MTDKTLFETITSPESLYNSFYECSRNSRWKESVQKYEANILLNTFRLSNKLRNNIYHEGNDGYLIFIPSNHADDFAPKGNHAITIYTVAPSFLKDESWDDKKEEYAEKLIKLAEKQLPDLSKYIVTKKIMTSLDYAKYTHMKKSSFGGVVPIDKQKNPTHITPVEHLYFVGQQSENAGGLGNVILGAKSCYTKFLSKK